MAAVRGSGHLPLRRTFKIEGKSFLLNRTPHTRLHEAVWINEQHNDKRYAGLFSLAGASWLGKLLEQLSISASPSHTPPRYNDPFFSFIWSILRNRNGRYVHVQIFHKELQGKPSILCFPEGRNQSGWAALGAHLVSLSLPNPISPLSTTLETTTLRGPDIRGTFLPFKVALNNNEDNFAIVATADSTIDDWPSFESEFRLWLEMYDFRPLNANQVVVFLKDKVDSLRICKTPPVSILGKLFKFELWKPISSSIDPGALNPRVWRIKLLGMPPQLRTPIIVSQVAALCGKNFSFDDSFLPNQDFVRVTLKDTKLLTIPRVVTLNYSGLSLPILVEVELDRVLWSPKLPPVRDDVNVALSGEGSVLQPGPQNHTMPALTCLPSSSFSLSVPPGFERQSICHINHNDKTSSHQFVEPANSFPLETRSAPLPCSNTFHSLESVEEDCVCESLTSDHSQSSAPCGSLISNTRVGSKKKLAKKALLTTGSRRFFGNFNKRWALYNRSVKKKRAKKHKSKKQRHFEPLFCSYQQDSLASPPPPSLLGPLRCVLPSTSAVSPFLNSEQPDPIAMTSLKGVESPSTPNTPVAHFVNGEHAFSFDKLPHLQPSSNLNGWIKWFAVPLALHLGVTEERGRQALTEVMYDLGHLDKTQNLDQELELDSGNESDSSKEDMMEGNQVVHVD
ncbi:hypothetical protein FRX31_034589 [Thalictrum thalictroides]|uniref:Uncharacterized protein n=1 Tax=Thalictrum thalictroides TaxID=46969 RepID=A0A7J6UT95_THATH|nr:hypothetical protein FRX31_034589 [Thalictrum thalictroides]